MTGLSLSLLLACCCCCCLLVSVSAWVPSTRVVHVRAAAGLLANEEATIRLTGVRCAPSMALASPAYFLAGGLACMVSHTVAVPFDVIKTRQQTSNAPVSLRQLIKEEGPGILLQGLGPTLLGYAIQGSLKYGFYELFKPVFQQALHVAPGESSIAALMLAGAFAECIGSSCLSPFEAARIRLVANPGFVQGGVLPCLRKIAAQEGRGALFFGLPAILAKQVPYTVIQLSSFETLSGLLSGAHLSEDRFTISVVSALAAAFLSSLASQPGDTLLSIVNKTARRSLVAAVPAATSVADSAEPVAVAAPVDAWSIIRDAVGELGFKGLFRGTQARLVHVGVIVVTQLLIYDGIKAALGIPLTTTH